MPTTYDDPMDEKWQFSIGYLLLETFWIALVIGIVCSLPSTTQQMGELKVPILFGAIGAAMGGTVLRMRAGAAIGLCVWAFVRLLELLQTTI